MSTPLILKLTFIRSEEQRFLLQRQNLNADGLPVVARGLNLRKREFPVPLGTFPSIKMVSALELQTPLFADTP